ncbi:MAG: sigma 54-interacting transcriptional regulator [Acidobacteria bacterium]|nr:sigma 54-interacting transcriptional regulator [Acidobacteriota bacterium]
MHNLLDVLFRAIPDGLVVYDRDMRITAANPAAEHIFGMSAEAMVGRPCREVFGCGSCDHHCGIAEGLIPGPDERNSTVHIHDGRGLDRVALIRTVALLDEQGEPNGAVATFRAVSNSFVPVSNFEIIAESSSMKDVMTFVRRVAASEASTILLEGENGTGKDLLAKALHYQSLHQGGAFTAINCAAIPDTLLESELFGHEKGAYTDARAQKRGLFELAAGGTLFLDEIGEIPMPLQAKLLRCLEERTFKRLGGLKDIDLDARVIAATNRNLREAVKEGAFRQDLYFRLNVIHIDIPPLRERRADIVPLARFFVDQYNRKFKRHIDGLTAEAETALLLHNWPGNVRELRNAIERAMILEDSSRITAGSLPLETAAREVLAAQAAATPEEWVPLEESERRLVERALATAAGNQTQAARLLSITRDTLRYKMKKFGFK